MKLFKKSKLIDKLTKILETEKMLASKGGNYNSQIYYNRLKATKKALHKIYKL